MNSTKKWRFFFVFVLLLFLGKVGTRSFFAEPISGTTIPQTVTTPVISPEESEPSSDPQTSPSVPTTPGNWDNPLQPVAQTISEPQALQTGRIFYVAAGGSDQNGGSEQNPWRSIQQAVSNLRAGDTLLIQEGTYQEGVKFQTSGTQGAWITVKGIGNVVLEGANLIEKKHGFDTNGQDYLRLQNLTINHMIAAVHVGVGSQFVEIDGLRADGNKYAVRINTALDIIVRNAYATNSNNAFRGYGASQNLLFEDVKAYDSKDIYDGMDPNYRNGDGFVFESEVSNLTIRRATSANNWDAGFDIKASNVLIENAGAYGNKNNFKTWGNNITIRSSLSRHAKREYLSGGSSVEGNGITVVSGTTKVIGMTFVDNEDHDVRIYSGGNLILESSLVARQNLNGALFKNSGTFQSQRVLWYSKGLSKPNFTLGSTDLWVDPQFVNWTAGDYHLKETSLAINFGSENASQSPYDLDRKIRIVDGRSDLGAFEYQTALPKYLDGIQQGDKVSGKIFVKPSPLQFPSISQVTYYLNGLSVYSTKSKPYMWGGLSGYDTTKLSNGAYILTVNVKISSKKTKRISIAFLVQN